MKLLSILFLFGVSSMAYAGPYLDLGIGAAVDVSESMGRNCIRDYNKDEQRWGCSSNPLGYAAIGYEHKDFTLEVSHWSSINHYDAGLNIISIKYRIK